jgi:hypothetical protein
MAENPFTPEVGLNGRKSLQTKMLSEHPKREELQRLNNA